VPSSAMPQAVKPIVRGLQREYPDAECALQYKTPEQLLVATILSAQCTDQRVNQVTAELFRRYPTPKELARVETRELETLIQSTGFFRNKAKNIKACCTQLVEQYHGKVPRELESLVRLPGVGRKTANVVLGTAYGLPTGVVVDTHVARLCHRLGLTQSTDPVKIERELMALLPRREWIMFSHRLIHHGRRICQARKPMCDQCCLAGWCPRIGIATKSSRHR
jgi:endonuclease-3